MFKLLVLVWGTLLLFPGTCKAQSQQAGPPPAREEPIILKCDQQRVVYSRFDEAYSKRIVWQSVTKSENPPTGTKREYSPQRTKWNATVEPDTSKPGPWNTTIYFGSTGNEEVWKLSVSDNIGTDFKWLSEKLVFGTVWWGRIYATEVILDLDNHKFIYKEMANYGDIIQPCQ